MAENNNNNELDIQNMDEYIEKRIEIKLNDLLQTLPDKPLTPDVKRIYEMTVSEIYINTLQTAIDILNDLTEIYSNKNYVDSSNYMTLIMNILLKENRKIYLGILLVVMSFILYFIDGASV
jgi:hypothetical protein